MLRRILVILILLWLGFVAYRFINPEWAQILLDKVKSIPDNVFDKNENNKDIVISWTTLTISLETGSAQKKDIPVEKLNSVIEVKTWDVVYPWKDVLDEYWEEDSKILEQKNDIFESISENQTLQEDNKVNLFDNISSEENIEVDEKNESLLDDSMGDEIKKNSESIDVVKIEQIYNSWSMDEDKKEFVETTTSQQTVIIKKEDESETIPVIQNEVEIQAKNGLSDKDIVDTKNILDNLVR